MCRGKPYFPMFVDISEKKIVLVGGGRIAERRVDTLLKFAGNITVIAPGVTEKIRDMSKDGNIHWIAAVYSKDMESFLQDAYMVFAATNDSACNERIMNFCREHGILVNVSHKKELCDFYFPAVVVKENVTVGITSGGLSHTQAREVRQRIEATL